MDYQQFLQSKITVADRSGFDVDPGWLHPDNKPHQRDGIIWALRMGRALLAWSFGLGKSRAQIEIARAVHRHTGKPFLIICPLGVKHQFQEEDGPALSTTWTYVRNDAEARAGGPYLITNYERVRDGGITQDFIRELAGVSLDEGSIQSAYTRKRQKIGYALPTLRPAKFPISETAPITTRASAAQ